MELQSADVTTVERDARKADLLRLCRRAACGLAKDREGETPQASRHAAIAAALTRLTPCNPIPKISEHPEMFCGTWELLYTDQSAPRYSNLGIMTFGLLPALGIETHGVFQVVRGDHGYSNVIDVTIDSEVRAFVVVRGQWQTVADHLERLAIAFLNVDLRLQDPTHEAAWARRFASEQTAPGVIHVDFPPTLRAALAGLHIDTPYLDTQLRVSRGNKGHTFVLQRCATAFDFV